jgi:PAS domain S-box-containing protein
MGHEPISRWRQLLSWFRNRHHDQEKLDAAFVALVNGMAGPAVLLNAEGRVQAVSAALLAGEGGLETVVDIRTASDSLRDQVLRTGRGCVETIRQPGPPESVHVTSAAPMLGPKGEVRSILVVAVDVTAGELARERCAALEHEVHLLLEMMDHVPHPVYAKDTDHRFVQANRAAARKIMGTPDSERLLGKSDHDFLPKADADRDRAEEQRLMAARRDLVDFEDRNGHQERETWNLITRILRRGPSGKVEGIIGIDRDITALRRAEIALEAERRLRISLMDNSPDLIFFKDREGRFTAMNKAYASLIGLDDPAKAIGRPSAEILGTERANDSRREEESIFKDGRPLLNKEIASPGAGKRWLLVSKVPVRDASERVTSVLGIARDITERKLAEEALARGLTEFLEVANAVSEGDLTRRGRMGEDTLGRVAAAVNRMLERFGEALVQVRQLAEAVSNSAAEIGIASNEIARGAQQQSEETLGVSAAAEEIARSMRSVSKSAEDAAAMALQARDIAQQGDRLAGEASESMGRIERSMTESVEHVRRHQRASEEILDVVETIKELADQTNLLSLNAAIEAARAGASGAGFSVIAGAIRELADKSAEAAKEVDGRLNAMQAGTAEALLAMEDMAKAIKSRLELVSVSLRDLHAITTVVGAAVVRSGDISRAAQEQTLVTDDLARRMHTIAAIAGQTSAAAEESARTVATAARMADELRKTLGRFRID